MSVLFGIAKVFCKELHNSVTLCFIVELGTAVSTVLNSDKRGIYACLYQS